MRGFNLTLHPRMPARVQPPPERSTLRRTLAPQGFRERSLQATREPTAGIHRSLAMSSRRIHAPDNKGWPLTLKALLPNRLRRKTRIAPLRLTRQDTALPLAAANSNGGADHGAPAPRHSSRARGQPSRLCLAQEALRRRVPRNGAGNRQDQPANVTSSVEQQQVYPNARPEYVGIRGHGRLHDCQQGHGLSTAQLSVRPPPEGDPDQALKNCSTRDIAKLLRDRLAEIERFSQADDDAFLGLA